MKRVEANLINDAGNIRFFYRLAFQIGFVLAPKLFLPEFVMKTRDHDNFILLKNLFVFLFTQQFRFNGKTQCWVHVVA